MNLIQAGNIDRRRDQRSSDRVITLELEGQFYSTLDWSLGGFLIEGYEGALEPGNSAPVSIILEDGSETIEQPATASIVRIVQSDLELRQLAAKFDDLSDDTFGLLESWQSGNPAGNLDGQPRKATA